MTPDPVSAGEQLTVGLTYGNGGTLATRNAVLTDVIPPNTTFVSAAGGGIYDTTTRTITWILGDLAGGSSFTVSYLVSAPSPVGNHTPLTDMASLISDNHATVTGHGTAYTARAPSLVFIDVPNANPVAAGAPLSYTCPGRTAGRMRRATASFSGRCRLTPRSRPPRTAGPTTAPATRCRGTWGRFRPAARTAPRSRCWSTARWPTARRSPTRPRC